MASPLRPDEPWIELRTAHAQLARTTGPLQRALLALSLLAILLVASDGNWTNTAIIVFCVGLAISDTRRARPTVLRVSPDGLTPRPGAFIPAERLAGVEVRAWATERMRFGPMGWTGISLQLDDGTEVCAPALMRHPNLLSPASRDLQATTIEWRSSEDPAWRPLTAEDGTPRAWSAKTDEAVRDQIDALLERALRPAPATRPTPRPVKRLGVLKGVRAGSGRAMANLILIPGTQSHTWRPLKPYPTAVPLLPSRADLPAWDVRADAVCFQSRASARSTLEGKHFTRFTPKGVDLVRRRRTLHIPYDRIDRIDDAVLGDALRRLSIVETDGSVHPLAGLRHGSWVADPSLRKNELQWWWGERPQRSPDEHVGWGSNDDPLAVARLRLQLDAMRAPGTRAMPERSATPDAEAA